MNKLIKILVELHPELPVYKLKLALEMLRSTMEELMVQGDSESAYQLFTECTGLDRSLAYQLV